MKLWEEELGSKKELAEYNQFKEFLDTRLKILESIADTIATKSIQSKPIKDKTLAHHAIKDENCPVCHARHVLQKCPKYNNMNVQARRKIIQGSGRCLNCLSMNHSERECTSKFRCFKCSQLHHTSLHEDIMKKQSVFNSQRTTPFKGKSNTNDNKSSHIKASLASNSHNDSISANSASAVESNTTQSFVTSETFSALLATALVTAQAKHGKPSIIRCLIDPGSQSSFITEASCKKLHATCIPTEIVVKGVSSNTATIAHKQATLQLRSCHSTDDIVEEDFLVIKKITDHLPKTTIALKDCQHLTNLQLADSTFWKPGKIDALLGAKVYANIIQEGVRRNSNAGPVAIKTLFGWILLGPTNQTPDNSSASFSITTDDRELSKQIQRFWEIEEIQSKPILTTEEQECQALYQTTHVRLNNGKYQVKLPFHNNENPKLGNSRPQALRRFINLQHKFTKNSEFQKEYTKCLNEYIELGHMEEVEPPEENELHYYIPHHAVFKESSTTRVRVVFDASCKSSNGKSLNDYLMKGPILQPKLFSTLLKWRKYKIALNADLEKMYRMIEIHPEQRTFQRIIWQHPTTGKLQDYQLKTVTFGTSSAPYLAIRTIKQLAEDERHKWPLAAMVMDDSFYVDDLLTGADTVIDAKELQCELINILKSGGFNLRKWASNNPKLLEDIPPEHRELKGTLSITEDETIKTLGIQWHPAVDNFTFKLAEKRNHNVTTKRTILSEVASLYDPLGWLAPVIIIAKILMQALWITGCSWDNPVSQSIDNQWKTFQEDLNNVIHIRIPRWIHYSPTSRAQLHGFCDASGKAYAAVLYLRVETQDKVILCNLLTAKTRVAPIKPTTIPRLELNGAVLLARLIKTTIEDMQLGNIPIFAWTDSTIVLQWIKEHPARWKTYVANRVVEIQDIIRYDNWHHIPGDYNPADLASRGITTSNLIQNKLWWHGPSWLTKPQNEWPKYSKIIEQTELEAKPSNILSFVVQPEDNILLRYSSYTRLIRIIATIKRFIHNCKNPQARYSGPLSSAEWRQAEITILRLVQMTVFQEDYTNLLKGKQLSPNSKLLRLNPFVDENKLLRVGGRLENAMIPYNQKHSVILPKDHYITQLIINKIHRETLHGGTSLVLASSRDQYWILDARRAITSQIHKCITCTRFRKEVTTQLMGNLPSCRVNAAKPFAKVGIDYAGPITIKSSPCRKAKLLKGYICIFICMATKAAHIELVSSLTSEAFIAALKRFIARRGLCTDIYSDCGTNFVGGKSILEKDLKEAIKTASTDAAQYISSKSINWHFNPPAAPHFGGLWEASVKSMKYHLHRVLKNITCTFEEYATVLTQIEACLNSRPIYCVRNDPDESLILTPGHFLIGQALNAVPEPDYSNDNLCPARRWTYLQQLSRHFWNKWAKDYLNQLQNRPKWLATNRNIRVGDIVLIRNEQMTPNDWPLGIIEQVYPGKDGLVRVVQVRTQNSSLQRPIAKICRLPVEQTSTWEETMKQ